MAIYITIDGGTTNTRVSLVQDGHVKDTIAFAIGAGNCAAQRKTLCDVVRDGIYQLLQQNRLTVQNIKKVIASGMITSETGLYTVDHISAPAGINNLHRSLQELVYPHIIDMPIVFIPGIRIDAADYESADMMRGEEAEVYGLPLTELANCVIILPGSHSKIIRIDENECISDFSTLLSGEMIAALAGHTILSQSVELNKAQLQPEWLQKGYRYTLANNINKALFKVRILKNKYKLDQDGVYSFFIGAVLCGEIQEILRSAPQSVVIAGQSRLKQALALLLRQNSDCQIQLIEDSDARNANALGMVRIVECDPE